MTETLVQQEFRCSRNSECRYSYNTAYKSRSSFQAEEETS